MLLQAGIVADERTARDARARVFRLRPQSMVGLQAWLDQLQARWDAQLQSFRRHLNFFDAARAVALTCEPDVGGTMVRVLASIPAGGVNGPAPHG